MFHASERYSGTTWHAIVVHIHATDSDEADCALPRPSSNKPVGAHQYISDVAIAALTYSTTLSAQAHTAQT